MTTSTMTFRTVDGVPVPSAGTFQIDPAHTHVGFSVRHLMVARVRGRFASLTGTVVVGEDPIDSAVAVSIDAASIDTGAEQRDAHLRSPDFFDVEAHPSITFESSAIRPLGATRFELDGQLTIKGMSQPVTFAAELEGVGLDPWGNERAGFSARATVDRETWGLTWNQPLEAGGVLLGRTVTLEIDAEIVRS